MVWEPESFGESDRRRLEDRAAQDAHDVAKRCWEEGILGGQLEPIAVSATYAYIAALKQESTAIPRWAWVSQEAMRGYIQMTGDRYYASFLDALGRAIGHAVPIYRRVPPTTPTLASAEEPPAPSEHPRRRTSLK